MYDTTPQAPAEPGAPPPIDCIVFTPNCGVQGVLVAPCNCLCTSGWSTASNQDLANPVYCTARLVNTSRGFSNGTNSTNSGGGSSNKASEGLGSAAAWLGIVAGVVVVTGLCLYSYRKGWCFVVRQKLWGGKVKNEDTGEDKDDATA